MRILKQSHGAEKVKGDPLDFFKIRFVAKYQKKLKKKSLETKKFSE